MSPKSSALIGKSFNGLPVKIDNPGCKYVYINAIATNDRSVQLRGQPALILAAVGVCEWETPTTINPNQCSQKNVWFFQKNIPPFELISTAFKAFVEPQDRYWVEFRPGTAHESRAHPQTRSPFFSKPTMCPLMNHWSSRRPSSISSVPKIGVVQKSMPRRWRVLSTRWRESTRLSKDVISYGATTLYIKWVSWQVRSRD